MKQTDLAYTAGIIDGEGCISVTRNTKGIKKALRAKASYCIYVAVSMTDFEVPAWLHFTFGGSFAEYKASNTKHKKVYRWGLHSNNAQRFLKLILPYLKTKKRQAELVIELQKLKKPYGTYAPGKFKAMVLQEAEEILANKIYQLNQGRMA